MSDHQPAGRQTGLEAAMRSRGLVAWLGAALGFGLSLFMVVVEQIYPSRSTSGSPYPVAAGFAVLGLVMVVLARKLAAQRAAIGNTLAQMLRDRAERVQRGLLRGPLTIYPCSRPNFYALTFLLVWVPMLAVVLLFEAAMRDRLAPEAVPIPMSARAAAYLLLLAAASLVARRRLRRSYVLDTEKLTLPAGSQPASLAFVDLARATLTERVMSVRGMPLGVRVTLALVPRDGTRPVSIPGEFSLSHAGRVPTGDQYDFQDLFCWLWWNKCPSLGLELESAYLPGVE